MKRFLLIMFAAVIVSATYAQETMTDETLISSSEENCFTELAPSKLIAEKTFLFDLKNNAPRRSRANGLYFLKPTGSLYHAQYESPNSGSGATSNMLMVVPDFKPYTYVNMSDNAATTRWFYATTTKNTYEITEYEDENYNMTLTNKVGEQLNLPVLWDADQNNSYCIRSSSSTNQYFSRCHVPTYFSADGSSVNNWTGECFAWLLFVDNKTEGGSISSGTFFTNNTHVMGSGTYEGTRSGYDAEGNEVSAEGTYVGDAIYQSFSAPISPIYVDYIYMRGVSTSDDPLPDGLELNMEIYDYYTQELLYTLVASTGDFTKWSTSSGSGILKFTNIVDVDPHYGNITGSFVIDRAISIKVTGFDQEGVDLGCVISPINEWDDGEGMSEGCMTYKAVEGGEGIVTPAYYHYSSPYAFAMFFVALMDGVQVEPTLYYDNGKLVVEQYNENGQKVEGDFSVLRISNDGTTCTNDDVAEEYNLGGAYVRVVTDWSYDNRDNYTMVDAPDWITGMYQVSYDEESHAYIVDFEAEPLPTNMPYREADIYIQGRGFTSEAPIHVVQGDGMCIVNTFEATDVTDISATLNGAVIVGLEEITRKGFVYWDGDPNIITTIIVDGEDDEMVYTLESLTPETTYTYRAYATTESGTTYGEEMTFTTRSKDFVLPTVVTYLATDITSTSALIKGFVEAGTEDVVEQGFEYWTGEDEPETITSDDNVMAIILAGLSPETTYTYRAFAVTDSGTTYGEEIEFTTLEDTTTGIRGISIDDENVEGIYSTSGQKLNSTQKGVNIIRYNDGTVKKIFVK